MNRIRNRIIYFIDINYNNIIILNQNTEKDQAIIIFNSNLFSSLLDCYYSLPFHYFLHFALHY